MTIPAAAPARVSWPTHTAVLTRRILVHWKQRPFSIAVTLLFPVLIVVMFGQLFGGAMAIRDGAYIDFLIPGMLAMTMLFGLESTVLAVTSDASKGVTERIRAMPVSGLAVLTGRCLADLISSVAGLVVMMGAGLALGWRPQQMSVLGAVGLLLWLRFAFVWVGIYLGLLLKTPESAVSVQVLVWPVGFLSGVFVSPDTMPAWLSAVANWNPLTATASAVRELASNPAWAANGWAAEHSVLLAMAWPAVLTLIFLPLATRRYRMLGR
ncbi:ABC transporter permease [Amycolatopsis sp. NPDC004079]|uniref:ABC transporter permease n=1 Tax=Amycolatopsis sp. NPDC004079 TaxID=3154549 RepID=UPI0033B7C0BF